MTTLSDLMDAGVFRSLRLVAGAAGIARRVHWMHISEILDDFSIFRQDELVVTTGYGLAKEAARQEEAIRMFARRHVAGVVFKQGYYLDAVAESALAAADRLAVPVFVAPAHFDVADFTERLGALLVRERENGIVAAPYDWQKLMLAWPSRLEREGHVIVAFESVEPRLMNEDVIYRVDETDVHFALILCRDGADRLSLAADARAPIGISSFARGPRHLERQRKEARAALTVGRLFDAGQTLWEEAEPFFILSTLLKNEDLASFASPLMRRIRALGLEETVTAICAENSLRKSAERLGIHRNTLTYRLERLQAEIGLPISRPLVRRWLDWVVWLGKVQGN